MVLAQKEFISVLEAKQLITPQSCMQTIKTKFLATRENIDFIVTIYCDINVLFFFLFSNNITKLFLVCDNIIFFFMKTNIMKKIK
jgi:hypothetical protein